MRLVSWNIRKNPQAVEYTFDALGADVLLAQECNKRSQKGLESVGEFIDERWVGRKWGNMIFSKTPLSPLLLETEYKGSMTAASVESPIGKLGLVNLYGLFEKVSPEVSKKSVVAGLHRKLSDLSPLLRGQIASDCAGFLMAGDFNVDRRMDSHKNFKRGDTRPVGGVMARIEDFGLTDLLRRDYPDYVQTYRPVRGSFPWQLDHAFVSDSIAGRAAVEVLSSGEIDALSDHRPILVKFD
jgi:endonuclease/exonuclease/phosphatase (EEP) superfamily protein YafD